jgi:hypothetical protein
VIGLWAAAAEPVRWADLSLSIRLDPYTSSNTATLCRVRVVNNGPATWPGRRLRFEARALSGGQVVERRVGRFGLTLAPRESLETIIGFSGVYSVFEVAPLAGRDGAGEGRSRRGGGRRKGRRR